MFVTELYARGWDVGFTLPEELEQELRSRWEAATAELGSNEASKSLWKNLRNVRSVFGPFIVPGWAKKATSVPSWVNCPVCYWSGKEQFPVDGLCFCSRVPNDGAPRSIRQIFKDAGLPPGGQRRKLLAKAIDDALFTLWLKAFDAQGREFAACVLASVVGRDPTYEPEPWVAGVLKRNRKAIEAAFRPNQANPY